MEGATIRQLHEASIRGDQTHLPLIKQSTLKVLGILLALERPVDGITIPFGIANQQDAIHAAEDSQVAFLGD